VGFQGSHKLAESGILREFSESLKLRELSGNFMQLQRENENKQNSVTSCSFWGAKMH